MLSFILRLAVLLISVQFSINLKYGYYLTGSINQTSTLSVSQIMHFVSEVSRDFNIEFRGTILNLRNENKTGDLYFIIYSNENSIGGLYTILVDMSYQLKQMEFYNINISFAYFAMMDLELSPASINMQLLFSKKSDYTLYLKSLYQSAITGFNFQFFDPPIPTFNKFFVSFTNTSDTIKAKILSTICSSNNYSRSNQYQIDYPLYLRNLNATIYQVEWDKLSIYSSEGTIKYEYYITGTFNMSFLTFMKSKNIIDFSYQIFQNISNSFSLFGVLFEGEILLINNSTNTIDFHGSLLRENKELREINYISTQAIPAIENVIVKNIMIYNIFQATVYSYLDNFIYNTTNFLQNTSAFKNNLEKEILYGLLKENLILLNGNYYEFVLQVQSIEDKIGILAFFIVFSNETNLFEMETRILKVFRSLPATNDPFNTRIERLKRQTIENYAEYNVPSSSFNVSSSLFLPVTSSSVEKNFKLTTDMNTALNTFTSTASKSNTSDTTMQRINSTIESQKNFSTQSTTSINKPTTNIETPKFTSLTSSYTENIAKATTTVLINTTTKISTIASTNIQSTSYTTKPEAPSTNKLNTTFSTQSTTTKTVLTITTKMTAGSTSAKVDLKCTFKEQFLPAYNDKNSEEYKDFTGKRTKELEESFSKNGKLKLLSVIYNSITEGSVVVNLTLSTLSDTYVDSSQIKSNVENVTTNAFGINATVDNIAVSSIISVPNPSTMNTYEYSTTAPDSWKIAVGVTFGIIGIILIVLIILHVSGHLKKIVKKLKGYIQKKYRYV